MILKNLITFFMLAGLACSAAVVSVDVNLPDLHEDLVGPPPPPPLPVSITTPGHPVPAPTGLIPGRGGCIPIAVQPNWKKCDTGIIRENGIPYLRSVTNPCDVGPGPSNCVRVSCSWRASIYLCNDNEYTIYPDCNLIADYANYTIDQCQGWSIDYHWTGGGQFFSDENWNVVVRWDKC